LIMKKERDKYFSYYKESNFLRYKQFYLERDILRIAFSLFEAEKSLKKNGLISNIPILLSKQTFNRIDVGKLKQILEELFLLIMLEDVSVEIKDTFDTKGRIRKRVDFPKKEAIVLFSAGVDSYSGIKLAEAIYKNLLGLFVAHNDQPRIINIVEKMKPNIGTEIRTFYAPGMGSMGYSQLRGFLYILCGGAYANLCKASKILVTECGPTMYQPLFSPYDSITYTTHPYVLKAAKDVLDLLLDFKPKIIIPFEDLTKAEVISNSGITDYTKTHSCISQRFGEHDGTCFGCVIKKLACLVSGVRDVKYNKDVFDEEANQDNLLNVLAYSEDLISNYENMPSFQKEKIEEFDKKDLFQRNALDNLAGLMLGVGKKHPLYKRYILGEDILNTRISQVRENRKRPDFNKCVS
jgi:7-cyano-7-deazaguanine synthase in queuosine biosynthesis